MNFRIMLMALLFGTTAFGQSGALRMEVVDAKGAPIPLVTAMVQGTEKGASADFDGIIAIEGIEAGSREVLIRSVGYKPELVKVEVEANRLVDLGQVAMAEDMFGLDEVVVTGTMRETFVKISPIKVEVVTSKFLERTIAPTNLVEGISMVNGVQEVTACGVCFTNSISINGLPGPYTAVLMDGAPIYGNLASVYGLNGIPIQMIDRFEIVKGPSSTLYGSEAVAGVINIITKDPEAQPTVAIDIMNTSHLESFGNISIAPKAKKWNGMVGLNYAYINDFDDRNADGFGDVANLDRYSLFTKWSKKRDDFKESTIAAKLYYEDRRNGVEDYLVDRAYRDIRGNDSVYGESIYTQRAEVFGKYDLPGKHDFELTYSLSHHDQNSYYGSDYYQATQSIAFSNLTYAKRSKKHQLLFGLTNRLQRYDDNTIATENDAGNAPDEQYIPGVFAQDEWSIGDRISLLAGMRFDYYQAHGIIPAPRLNVKYRPSEWTTLRLNAGTGFRIVNLFTEDHAFVTGQRSVEIREKLNPESSYNTMFNLNHVFTIGNSQGTIDADVFYTYFSNKINPDYDTPGKIIYENSTGYAESKGVNVSLNQQFGFPLAYSLGFNVMESTETEYTGDEEITSDLPFAPNWSGIANVGWDVKRARLNVAYTLRLTGPMTLPEVYDLSDAGSPLPLARAAESKPFTIHNLQINKAFKNEQWSMYFGVQNLLDFVQAESPLTGVNDPNARPGFSQYFDTSYAYAPLHGREFYIGVRWKSKK